MTPRQKSRVLLFTIAVLVVAWAVDLWRGNGPGWSKDCPEGTQAISRQITPTGVLETTCEEK